MQVSWKTGQSYSFGLPLASGNNTGLPSILALRMLDKISFQKLIRGLTHGVLLQTNKRSLLYLFLHSKDSKWENDTAGTLLRTLSVS